MRKLILITAMVLVSATANAAGLTRGLVLASSEQPSQAQIQQTPIQTQAPAQIQAQPQAAPVQTQTPTQAAPAPAQQPAATTTVQSAAAATTEQPAPKSHPVAKKRESDEAKARRIAARYGISW